MAGNAAEIQRLRRELAQTNRKLQELEENYRSKLQRRINVIREEFAQSMAAQQADVAERFQKLERSMSEAYLREVEDMRAQYGKLEASARQKEELLNQKLLIMEKEQTRFFEQRSAHARQEEGEARANMEKLKKSVESACLYPVDRFFPHAIQRYIEAGQEAERLLKQGLFSLAAAKADVACMAVEELKSKTEARIQELEQMFQRYQDKLSFIQRNLSNDRFRCLLDEDGNVILQLSETDVDYWSDQLYHQLLQSLEEHRKNVDGGVDGWLARDLDEGVSPALALDREMQRLDAIPQKLKICISYALSACDCYNYSVQVKELAEELLTQQNYMLEGVSFGECKAGNDDSAGYREYVQNYLSKAVCVRPGKMADFREERWITFTKCYGTGARDVCRIILVPRRDYDTVSLDMFLRLESDYLPHLVQSRLLALFRANGLPDMKSFEQLAQVSTAQDRPLNLQALDQFYGLSREKELTAKYSFST